MANTERLRITGEEEVEAQKRHRAVSEVRIRIRDELPADVAALKKHHPALYAELREIVCD